ncbi:MAG: TIGR03915 family putative DNA repair protein [Brotaphodocola sp.]
MTVFICGEEPEDIWCAIYDAWMSRLGHQNVRIDPEGENQELFCDYREVKTDESKAEKVVDSIRKKLSEHIFEEVYKAALSQERFRADKIYRFLIYAFAVGRGVMEMLQIPAVNALFQMNRHLTREYNHMLGFVRFVQMKNDILLAHIHPKNDITVLLADYFSDRMPSENWIIYDIHRKKAAVYKSGMGWVLVRGGFEEWQFRMERAEDEETFENLWRVFHQSIGIPERYNPRCQMTMLPLRFRPYMTEFQK